MLKNAVFFRVEPGFEITEADLAAYPARPCGSQEFSAAGFAAPNPDAPDLLVHSVNGYSLIALDIDERILPSSVIKKEAKARASVIESNEGRKVGRKEMREIEEAAQRELLPKAFTRKKRINAVFAGGLFIVDGSAKQAEAMTEALAHVVKKFPLSPYKVAQLPTIAMTTWLAEEAPEGMTIDDFCELVSKENQSITYRTQLNGTDIKERLGKGYLASRLAVTTNDRASMIVNDRLEIKRFALTDLLTEEACAQTENEAERFDIDLTLYVGELLRAIDCLTKAFGGELQDLAEQGRSETETPPAITPGDGADPLYTQAVEIVKNHRRPSTSLVQRHLRIGYNRAASLIESMERAGFVSAMGTNGEREWIGAEGVK